MSGSYNKNKPDALISQIYFWNKTLHVSDSSSVHHQEFFNVYTAMVYVIQVCWQLASGIRTECPEQPVWHIPLLCAQWKTPDDGQRSCPKHVEIYSKNKFEKLVHLVGFIIRIYHDARSPERQIQCLVSWTLIYSARHCQWRSYPAGILNICSCRCLSKQRSLRQK